MQQFFRCWHQKMIDFFKHILTIITNFYAYSSCDIACYDRVIQDFIDDSIAYDHVYTRTKSCYIHAVRFSQRFPKVANKKHLVLLHGAHGNSLSFLPIVNKLVHEYESIHAIDLPCFGNSGCFTSLDITAATTTTDDILIAYANSLQSYIIQNNVSNVSVLGHSFGGYLSIFLCHRNPLLFKKLILVAPVGIFPILNDYGYYSALLFQSGLPYCIFRACRCIIRPVLYAIEYISTWTRSRYIDQLMVYLGQFSTLCFQGDYLISKFISFDGMFHAYWQKTLVTELLHLRVPYVTIHGVNDNLIPCTQSKVWNCVTKSPLYLLDNAQHSPHIDRPSDFVNIVTWVNEFVQQNYTIDARHTFVSKVPHYTSSWNIWSTRQKRKLCYNDLIMACTIQNTNRIPSYTGSNGAPNEFKHKIT